MIEDFNEFKLAYSTIENELAFSPDDSSNEAWMKAFVGRVNDLILHDFNKLVLILYRFDVSEAKLRQLLKGQTNGVAGSAADIVCRLIIERQIQKIKTRQQFRRKDDISEEEKW